jgi:transcription elongation factor Elf1
MDKVVTKNQKFNCLECGNEIEVDASKNEGDYIECPFCGIEYEITAKTGAGEFELQIVEEEK